MVWTDTLQLVILVVGYLAMVIGGLVNIGGFGAMWEKAEAGGRINFNRHGNLLSFLSSNHVRVHVHVTVVVQHNFEILTNI